MKKLLILAVAVFLVGGIVNTIVVLTSPPVEDPVVIAPESLTPEEAARIQALTQERDVRQAWRDGLERGLRWAPWVYIPLLLLLALDYLTSTITGRNPRIEETVREWTRRCKGRTRRRPDEESP